MRRLILTLAVLAIVAGAVIAAVGALHIGSTEDKVNITIDKKQLKEKAEQGLEQAKETGSAILHQTGEALRKAGKELRKPSDDQPAPAASKSPAPDAGSQHQKKANETPGNQPKETH